MSCSLRRATAANFDSVRWLEGICTFTIDGQIQHWEVRILRTQTEAQKVLDVGGCVRQVAVGPSNATFQVQLDRQQA